MKTETETQEAGSSRRSIPGICPAPSLRIPVTAANRAFLRWLRAAELSAWEAASPLNSTRPNPINSETN